MAAEILASDIPSLLDSLVSREDDAGQTELSEDCRIDSVPRTKPHLDDLLAFIDTSQPLNSLSASFFAKIIINLLSRRANEVGFQ